MQIVSFEGADKSGKHTHSLEFAEELKNLGNKVMHSEFPRYDTPIGELISKYLHNELKVDRYTEELLQSADKQAQQKWFKDLEGEGYDYLVLDRYIDSQLAYGKYFAESNNKGDAKSKDDELKWQQNLVKYMRKPDVKIYLDVEPAESMKRKGQWGANDRYESDLNLLSKIRGNYLQVSGDELIVINSNRSLEAVSKDIKNLAKELDSYTKGK